MKMSEDDLEKLRKRREAVADKEEDQDLEMEDGDLFPDIPDRTEKPAKEQEKTAQEKVRKKTFSWALIQWYTVSI